MEQWNIGFNRDVIHAKTFSVYPPSQKTTDMPVDEFQKMFYYGAMSPHGGGG
jgi:hypothetical protein